MTAAAAVRLAHEGRLVLDDPLDGQLAPELLDRWRAFEDLPRTTPRQLLAHTSGLPNYFGDQAFAARVKREPDRSWRSGRIRRSRGRALGSRIFAPARASATPTPATSWSGFCSSRSPASRFTRSTASSSSTRSEWTGRGSRGTSHRGSRRWPTTTTASSIGPTISPTIDWAAGGLVTTGPDLTRFVRALWSEQILDSARLDELTQLDGRQRRFRLDTRCATSDYGLGTGPTRRGSRAARAHRLHRCLRVPRARVRRGAGRAPTTPRTSIAGRWWPRSAGNYSTSTSALGSL